MIRESLTAMALVVAAPLASAQSVSMCVFDVIGANGDFYNFVKDYALEMKGHGVDFELKPYTDEGVAIGDFNAGQCDAPHISTAANWEARSWSWPPRRSVASWPHSKPQWVVACSPGRGAS